MAQKYFEDSVCWQKSQDLAVSIYSCFGTCKDFGFRDQIQRASVSVMNNIAEGYERNTQKELKYFLYVSKGSCGELRSMLSLAKELKYIDEGKFETLKEQSTEVSKLLAGFIRKIND